MLLDSDSYVYLAAINALKIMGNYYIDKVFPLLIPQFSDNTKPIYIRIKIGEAISGIIQKEGEGIVKYKDKLLNIYLNILSANNEGGYKQQNKLKGDEAFEMINFRSSCLSTIGDICELCKWNISSYIIDLINICKSILEFERNNDSLIRISAIFLIYKIVNGMKEYKYYYFRDIINILDNEYDEIINILEITKDRDPDKIVKYHSESILKLLNEYSINVLLPNN